MRIIPRTYESTQCGSHSLDPLGVEGVRDPAVHHVHRALLPVQHLLDGAVGRDSLGVQRDYDVDSKSGMRSKEEGRKGEEQEILWDYKGILRDESAHTFLEAFVS